MASDTAILEVLEADLRSLCNEARKTDSLATQITGWLQHTNSPQIKESAERALVIVRATVQEGHGIEGIKTKEILRPFLLACQSRNPRLVGTVLGSIQRLLAHGAVSEDGRQSIIEALQQVENTSDDTGKLKILQTALTLLQNPSNVDDQEGACLVLSICMHIYSHNKGSPTIASTATATIRQAVALLFDHAMIAPSAAGSSAGTEAVALGREVAAVRLLQDLLSMCSGHPPTWLNCPLVGRQFVLDLLEFVLLHRPAVFHSNHAFKALLQTRLAPLLEELCRAALEPDMEPASSGEVKVLLRCVGALLKKHSQLVQQTAFKLLVTLQSGCAANRMAWQRVLSLQVLRWLVSDPQVLYTVFSTYDMSIDFDSNPIQDVADAACEVIRAYVRAADTNDEELLASLSGLYRSKQSGKEQVMDVDIIGPGQASQLELWVCYLAVDLLMALAAAFELLTDAVIPGPSSSNTSSLQQQPAGFHRTGSSTASMLQNVSRTSSSQQSIIAAADAAEAYSRVVVLSGSRHSSPTAAAAATFNYDAPFGPRLSNSGSLSRALKGYPLASGPVYTLASAMSKQVLPGISLVLTRCRSSSSHEALLLVLLRSLQISAQCAGALGDMAARDRFLMLLCEVSIAPAIADEAKAPKQAGDAWPSMPRPTSHMAMTTTAAAAAEEQPAGLSPLAQGASAVGSGGCSAPTGSSGSSSCSVVAYYLGLHGPSPVPHFTSKNVHALRTLFNAAKYLADGLGPSWMLLVEVLYVLDRALPAAAVTSSGKTEGGSSRGFELQHHLGNSSGSSASAGQAAANDNAITAEVAASFFSMDAARLTPDAKVSLMLALSEVSSKTLAAAQQYGFQAGSAGPAAGGAVGGPGAAAGAGPTGTGIAHGAGGVMRMPALIRMVEVLLHNLDGIQDLWGIFLAHVVEVLHSGNAAVRSAGIEALDKTLTSAIASPNFAAVAAAADVDQNPSSSSIILADDVEHMLLVALESVYKEEREPDVRLGLLRVALHVLQRHGDTLNRGWVPLLRLFEAVPSWEESSSISAAFQCVESVSSDFLPTMPKVHLDRALEVFYLYSAQKSVINISLSAIGLLWNATDLLGRSRAAAAAAAAATAAAAAAAAAPQAANKAGGVIGGLLSALSMSRMTLSEEAAAVLAAEKEAAAVVVARSNSSSSGLRLGEEGASDPHVAGRNDLSEAECVELLLKLFTHLRKISMDARPEVRNSGVRTLFLAVGSQAAKFSSMTWRYCLWEILFPLVTYVHVMGDTSSTAEAAAVELGKERGKAVMMLMHHSRNSEQKQWDETTVLALNGLGKVLKANMATVLGMPGFDEKWDEICGITAKMLGCGRRSVAVAAAQLLTSYLQSYKPLPATGEPTHGSMDAGPRGYGFPWKRTLQAIDDAVKVMAVPNTRVPLQARSELLTGLSTVYGAQAPEGAFDLADMQMLLHWLSALARHPTGADDVTPVPGVLPPVQKLVLQILGHFNTAVLPEAWLDVLRMLAAFLCPFTAMQQRHQQQQLAAAAAAAAVEPLSDASGPAVPAKLASPLSNARPLGKLTPSRGLISAAATDAIMLTNQWMGKICEKLVALYSHAPWQVRAMLFGSVVGGLGECAALRHLLPEDQLWRRAATGLVAVINAGLPAVNIMFVNHHQPPENAWQVLAGTFETFLLGVGLPEHLLAAIATERAWSDETQQQQGSGHCQHQHHHHQQQQQQQQLHSKYHRRGQRESRHSREGSSLGGRTSSAGEDPAAAENRLEAAVLDSLTDVVLASCSSAARHLRARLVKVVAAGAASMAGHTCCQHASSSSTDSSRGATPTAAAGAESSRQSTSESSEQHTAAVENGDPGLNSSEGDAGAVGEQAQTSCPGSAGAGGCVPVSKRLSQRCLRKLALLAGRGTEGPAGSMNAVMLEVAQIALPLLLQQCSTVLQAYATLEQAFLQTVQQQQHHEQGQLYQGQQQQTQHPLKHLELQQEQQLTPMLEGSASNVAIVSEEHAMVPSSTLGLQQQCLVDEVLCVLQILVSLQLDVSVLVEVLRDQPQVAACLDAALHTHMMLQQQQHHTHQENLGGWGPATGSPTKAAAGAAGSIGWRQQGHLLLVYNSLAACVGCRHQAVGALLRQALLAVGQQLFC